MAASLLLFAAAGPAGASFKAFTPEGEGVSYPSVADGRATQTPSIQAQRLGEGDRIKLDGRLDEEIWQRAETGRGFKMWEPDRGATPSEETVFKVAYDDDAIYFAVACLEKDPSRISSHLSRRDRFSNSDIVSVYIDPYLDRTTGYNFKVNPLGVLVDSYMYNDGDRDDDWDAVWEAHTYRDSDGWYAELRIPFSAIRYRTAESMTWGLEVYRYMHGRGEDTAWVTWDRNAKGFVSRFGQLTGLSGIRPPRQLEIMPYVVSKATDPAALGEEDQVDKAANMGADLKYGVSADLTMSATIQPDFGQVEADPAVLNLSPFETFYQEKRPFFIEGSRFYEHPDFNLFYSRRIGTGNENSRIRMAAKLTGKTAGNVSVAGLAASTDVTSPGQAHNIFRGGEQLSRYFVARFGKEVAGGRHRVNLMQTAVLNTGSREQYGDYLSREAYTTGVDFDVNSRNRTYNAQGSFVGSVIDPEASATDPTVNGAKRSGTGGNLDLRKVGGKLQGGVTGRWLTANLELNDLGYQERNDRITVNTWLYRPFNPEGKSKHLNRGELNLSFFRSWLYAGRTGYDRATGAVAWSYGPGHGEFMNTEISSWFQFRNYREAWFGLLYNTEGTQRYETREGPLIGEPATYGGWLGGTTDTRKEFTLRLEGTYFRDTANNTSTEIEAGVKWNQSSAINHELALSLGRRKDDTQYLETVDLGARPGGSGIGGYSYVFGRIDQQTADLTLRTNVLFSRVTSLEIYAQPYVTVGDYAEARELARPDTYDLIPYAEPGYQSHNFDFSYTSMNLNTVFRWEYHPGSTFYLVWTQGRTEYDQQSYHAGAPASFENEMRLGSAFGTEPQNVLLAKITYWFAL